MRIVEEKLDKRILKLKHFRICDMEDLNFEIQMFLQRFIIIPVLRLEVYGWQKRSRLGLPG